MTQPQQPTKAESKVEPKVEPKTTVATTPPATEAPPPLTLVRTEHICWRCCQWKLWHLTPAVLGLHYYCAHCRILTVPGEQMQEPLDAQPGDTCGMVAAVSCTIRIQRGDS